MMAVNLGTARAKQAAELLEYCNLPAGTAWADRRVANGRREPYGVKLWCLGNEMDGPWQAGHAEAVEYGRRAREASALMKGLDPTIETVACGSSNRGMATFMTYERETLEVCWDTVDYVSAHQYSSNERGDTPGFLAEGVEIDRTLDHYAGLLDYMRGAKKSKKRVYVSFDEWNVWYHSHGVKHEPWSEAPAILEDQYNLEDALVCAQYLGAFVRRADLVKVACIAQVVNVIAPVLTRRDGLLVQPTFHPFELFSRHARGVSLRPVVASGPTYDAGKRGEVPTLDVSATFEAGGGGGTGGDAGTAAVFLVNRDVGGELTVDVSFNDRDVAAVTGVDELGGGDVKATNTWERPDAVAPRPGRAAVSDDGRSARVTVPSPGLAVVRLELSRR